MRTLHAVGSMLIALALLCVAAAARHGGGASAQRGNRGTARCGSCRPRAWRAARRSVARVNARAERELDIIHAVSAYLNPWQLEHLRAQRRRAPVRGSRGDDARLAAAAP